MVRAPRTGSETGPSILASTARVRNRASGNTFGKSVVKNQFVLQFPLPLYVAVSRAGSDRERSIRRPGHPANPLPSTQFQFHRHDGSYYEGNFEKDNIEGQGTYYSHSCTFQGSFVDNEKSGFGKYEWQDGRVYEGQFLKDLKHGDGKFT